MRKALLSFVLLAFSSAPMFGSETKPETLTPVKENSEIKEVKEEKVKPTIKTDEIKQLADTKEKGQVNGKEALAENKDSTIDPVVDPSGELPSDPFLKRVYLSTIGGLWTGIQELPMWARLFVYSAMLFVASYSGKKAYKKGRKIYKRIKFERHLKEKEAEVTKG